MFEFMAAVTVQLFFFCMIATYIRSLVSLINQIFQSVTLILGFFITYPTPSLPIFSPSDL